METPIIIKARNHLDLGRQLKSDRNYDAALTEFRRAILLDPQLFDAHMEIGFICKARIDKEPYLQRHAYEAFHNAAKLDLQNQTAHDEYILSAQKMNKLDEVIKEYDNWIKHYPDNELLHRCKKNLITISMAMIPQQVNVSNAGPSTFIKKTILFASVASILFGLCLIIIPPMIKHKNLTKELMSNFIKVGLVFGIGGFTGLVVRAKIRH